MAADFDAVSDPVVTRWFGQCLRITWTSTAPAGGGFQLYQNGRLVWWGRETECLVPLPAARARFVVAAVPAGEERIDYSADLPASSGLADPIRFSWVGGRFLGPTVIAYRVFGEPSPGAGVDFDVVLAEVPAYPFGRSFDGWGRGRWGSGTWGALGQPYTATIVSSGPGVWAYAIAPVDASGELGTPQSVTVTVAGPPRPPEADAAGRRLFYDYSRGEGRVVLTWNASPAY